MTLVPFVSLKLLAFIYFHFHDYQHLSFHNGVYHIQTDSAGDNAGRSITRCCKEGVCALMEENRSIGAYVPSLPANPREQLQTEQVGNTRLGTEDNFRVPALAAQLEGSGTSVSGGETAPRLSAPQNLQP